MHPPGDDYFGFHFHGMFNVAKEGNIMGKTLLNWVIGICVGTIVLSILFPDTFGASVGSWLDSRFDAAANNPQIIQTISVLIAILIGIAIYKNRGGGGEKKH